MTFGAVVASPSSALEIAKDSREVTDGRCWRLGRAADEEDDLEFMVLCACSVGASFQYFTQAPFVVLEVNEMLILDACSDAGAV